MEKKLNKKFYWTASIVVLGAAIAVVLWLQSKPREWIPSGPTPDVPYYGEYYHDPVFPFPAFLDCSLVPPGVSRGHSWKGFQIGKTTFEEIIDIFKVEDVSWVNTKTYFDYISEDGTDYVVAACFSGDVLSALHYSPKGNENSFLGYFVENYGFPDYVTWSSYATERAAIWPEAGMLVTLEGVREPVPTFVILFSPIPLEEFGESWLWQALPDENDVTITNEETGLKGEDPWGIATHGTYELRVKQP